MKKQWILLLFCFCLFVFPFTAGAGQIREASEQSDLEYVFVHGLSGWGSYDARYQVMPYWGMFGGDLIKYLNGEGFPSYAASGM